MNSDSNSMSWLDKLAQLKKEMPVSQSDNDTAHPAPNENSSEKKTTGTRIDIYFEKKGRGGKKATIATGFGDLSDQELSELASKMKSRLGAGGSARGGEILIQGDRRNDVLQFLTNQGYKARII